MTGDARLCGAILEIAAHPRSAITQDRRVRAYHVARRAIIAGSRVLGFVPHVHEQPTHVPCFGHDVLCEQRGTCENPEPCGVDRFFGIHLVLDREPDLTGPLVWHLTPYAQLTICGFEHPAPDDEYVTLQPVTQSV